MYNQYEIHEMMEVVDAADVFLEASYRPKKKHAAVIYQNEVYSSVHGKMSGSMSRNIRMVADTTVTENNEKPYVNTDLRITVSVVNEDVLHLYAFGYIFDTAHEKFLWEPLVVVEINNKTKEVHWITHLSEKGIVDIDKFSPEISKPNAAHDHSNVFAENLVNSYEETEVVLEGFDKLLELKPFSGDLFPKMMLKLILDEMGNKMRPLSKDERAAICKKFLKRIDDRDIIAKVIESTVWFGKMNFDNQLCAISKSLINNNMDKMLYRMFKYPCYTTISSILLHDGTSIEEITGIEDPEVLDKLTQIYAYRELPDVVAGVKKIYKLIKDKEEILKLVEAYDRSLTKDINSRINVDEYAENFRFGLTINTILSFIDHFDDTSMVINKAISSFQ